MTNRYVKARVSSVRMTLRDGTTLNTSVVENKFKDSIGGPAYTTAAISGGGTISQATDKPAIPSGDFPNTPELYKFIEKCALLGGDVRIVKADEYGDIKIYDVVIDDVSAIDWSNDALSVSIQFSGQNVR